MIEKPLERITFADFEALIEAARPEGRRLDYKRNLPGGSDADRKEFLADISSFANAEGGDIVFGIDELNGVPTAITGISADQSDAAILRLESLALNGLQPRISGLKSVFVPAPAQPATGVLLMRVPTSQHAPHQVRFQGTNRFYTRHSKGKAEMDVNELRDAFVGSSEKLSRLRSLHGLLPRLSPVPLAGPSLLVTVVPLSLSGQRKRLDLRNFEDGVAPLWGGSLDCRQILEGLLLYSASGAGSYAQTLLYRTGWAESWSQQGSHHRPDSKFVWADRVEEDLEKSVLRSIEKLRIHGVDGPWLVQATLKDVHGYDLYSRDGSHEPSSRSEFGFGEVVFEDLAEHTLLPIKKELWWAFGSDRPDGWTADR